jgi:death on curing protein
MPEIPIEDFLLAAQAVLGIDAERLARVAKLPLAESALAAPFASYDGRYFYEDAIQRAAILASRIMRNHALPDGNKRVALLLADLYLGEHGYAIVANQTEIARTFENVASRVVTEDYFTTWLRAHVEPR